MERSDPIVRSSESLDHLGRAVLGSVVDDDVLPVLIRLALDAMNSVR
jgi:hypothetical protein